MYTYCTHCTKTFSKVMLIGFATEISRSTHTSALIAQDTIKSSVITRGSVKVPYSLRMADCQQPKHLVL